MIPDTYLRLIYVPINISQKNQISFPAYEAQYQYFMITCKGINCDRFSYQRKDEAIRVPYSPEYLYASKINYVAYTNKNFGTKVFYAFINRIEYVNENMSLVHIKTDVYQTWLFDFKINASFIARETVSDDTKYIHTLPEPVEIGEYTCLSSFTLFPDGMNLSAKNYAECQANYYLLLIMADVPEQWTAISADFIGGVPQACYYICCQIGNTDIMYKEITHDGKTSSVAYSGLIPKGIADKLYSMPCESASGCFCITGLNDDSYGNWRTFSAWSGFIDGYQPRNNKLFSYPYNFLKVTNFSGQNMVFKYENFSSPQTIQFDTYISVGSNMTISCVPNGYIMIGRNFDYAVSLSDFPVSAFANDAFAEYVALNKSSIAYNLFAQAGETISAAASGNISGAAGGIMSLLATGARIEDKQNMPNSMRGTPGGSMQLYNGSMDIQGQYICVKNEYAKIIDQFFDRFGYQVNETKKPILNSRRSWNYIETRDINISGPIPNDDILELCSMFNSGLTIWHTIDNFGDYTQDNSII